MDTQEQIAELEEQLSIALTALSNHVDTVIEQDAKIAELEARLAQASRWARLWKQAAKRRRTEYGDTLTAAYLAGRHDERKQREREAQRRDCSLGQTIERLAMEHLGKSEQ